MNKDLINSNFICKDNRMKTSIYRHNLKIANLLGVNYYRVKVDFARRKLRFLIPTLYFEEALTNLEHVLYSCDYFALQETRPHLGGNIIDAGAFLGFYTAASFVISKGEGFIHCIEPNVHVLPFLHENIRLNKVAKAKVLPLAICPTSGTQKIFIAEHPAVSSMLKDHVEYHSRIIGVLEVKCVKLSSLLDYLESAQLLKLDIEGLELDVLREALGELRRVKRLVVEVHTDVVDLNEVEITLEKAGFSRFFIFASSEMPSQIILHAMK